MANHCFREPNTPASLIWRCTRLAAFFTIIYAALLAFTNPTTNGFTVGWSPALKLRHNLAYGRRNRSAAIRIPMYSPNPKNKRIEFRCPDPSCNPYLAFSAILMAMIDGIANRMEPGDAVDDDLYSMTNEQLRGIQAAPDSLERSMQALAEDNAFLRVGDVFSEDLIATWISAKRDAEINPSRLQPTPMEYCMYFDV
ncbi:MAG: hypothetical protein R3C05_22420 [Pirellulaceae bacterium]